MEIEYTENCIYVTLPYEEGKEYAGKHYDYEDFDFTIDGIKHHILDCQVSENEKSVTLILVK